MIHKKFISIFLSIFLLISLFPTYHAVENNTITVENYGLIEDPYERLGAGFIDDTVELSTSYDQGNAVMLLLLKIKTHINCVGCMQQ